jgi:Uncharacterized protein conserved in bacteria (DUF2130)
MELVYQYLTGPRFRHRIEAVVERFSDMQADLDRERKTMMRLWAKREEQIRGVVESTAGLYCDLQGIAGRSLLEIDGLERCCSMGLRRTKLLNDGVAFAKRNDMEIRIHSVLMLAPRMSHIVCAGEDGKIRPAHLDRSLGD